MLEGIVGAAPVSRWREKPGKAWPVPALQPQAGHYSEGIENPVMKLELKPFDFNQAVARAGLRPDGTPLVSKRGVVADVEGAEPGNFRTAMADALANVSRDQTEAQRLQKEFSLDNPTVSLEQTMVAMQKSQIGFQAAVQVRNRLLSAYTDIMNMQV
jgi:flagellar hook-basal body complex protein FliE